LEVLEARGSWRAKDKSRKTRKTPKPKSKIPSKPNWLVGHYAVAEWRRATRELEENGLVSGLDRTQLASYCQAYQRAIEAEAELTEFGSLTCEDENGRLYPHPAANQASKSWALVDKLAKQFGMSPSSRTNIHAPSETETPKSGPRIFDDQGAA
jgi:P27 family predicted phage terminase small subunit